MGPSKYIDMDLYQGVNESNIHPKIVLTDDVNTVIDKALSNMQNLYFYTEIFVGSLS